MFKKTTEKLEQKLRIGKKAHTDTYGAPMMVLAKLMAMWKHFLAKGGLNILDIITTRVLKLQS